MILLTRKGCASDAKTQVEQLDMQYGDTLRTTLHKVLDEQSKKIVKQVQINVLAKNKSGEIDS